MVYEEIGGALEKIQQTVQRDIGTHVVLGKSYAPVAFDAAHFFVLNEQSGKTIAYVDGGNAEILGAANFSLQLIRTYVCVYQGLRRISHERKDFFILVSSIQKEHDLWFDVHYFGKTGLPASIKAEIGMHAPEPTQIAEQIRKLAELEAIQHVSADIIVRDGDLQSETDLEQAFYEKIQDKTIAGLAKTTTLFTNTGVSAAAAMHTIAPSGAWYYYPVAEGTPEVLFVKLHPASRYVFRFELLKKDIQHKQEIIEQIMHHAKDPLFLGYPYGLTEADRFGKVPLHEVQNVRMMFEAKAGKSFKDIERFANSINAHSVLDRQN